ncbi:microneme protein [Cystoisospora suis]|uniref:Microneme protein n=1 Tax=Cystoisospora suis TaxID=483139 RepID=A0A2C6L5C0_9APIC|nr:microneme protein [Cystoisospora suis]
MAREFSVWQKRCAWARAGAVLLASVAFSSVLASSPAVDQADVLASTTPEQLVSLVQDAGVQQTQCTKILDIGLLVDESGSIGYSNFGRVQTFLASFIELLPVSREEVHVAMVLFAKVVRVAWDFTKPEATDRLLASKVAKRLPYARGPDTLTDLGIRAITDILIAGRGSRQNVPKVLVVLTDGASRYYNRTVDAARKARNQGISVFVVGVGAVNTRECKDMVGCSIYDRVCAGFLHSDWSSLVTTVDSIMGEVCKKLPKDAECSPWSEWSPCSTSCGPGTRTKTRKQLSAPLPGDPPCPTCPPLHGKTCKDLGGLIQEETCNLGECPVNAGCGTWGEWSEWSATCGLASRSRKRHGYNNPPPRGGGLLCEQQQPPVPSEETEEKLFFPCPVNQTPGEWSDWTVCSATCGGGKRHRTRVGVPQVGELFGGQTLEQQGFTVREEEDCGETPCPVDATCGELTEWSECSRTCGGGVSTRTRNPWLDNQQHGGKTCLQQYPEGREESKACNTDPCPVDEVPGEWQEWGECSVTCGTGIQQRFREPSPVHAQNGGKTIEEQNVGAETPIHKREERECSPFPCGPCTYEYAEWSECRGSCPTGHRERHTAVRFDYPDRPCDLPTVESEECTPEKCSADLTGSGAGKEPSEEAGGTGGSEGTGETTQPEEGAGGETETETTPPPKEEQEGTPAAAIAGGVVGGVLLLGAAGGGAYYMTAASGGSAAQVPQSEFVQEQQAREVQQEEREAMVGVDEESDMWSA